MKTDIRLTSKSEQNCTSVISTNEQPERQTERGEKVYVYLNILLNVSNNNGREKKNEKKLPSFSFCSTKQLQSFIMQTHFGVIIYIRLAITPIIITVAMLKKLQYGSFLFCTNWMNAIEGARERNAFRYSWLNPRSNYTPRWR